MFFPNENFPERCSNEKMIIFVGYLIKIEDHEK